MLTTIIISSVTIIAMIVGILFFPTIKLGKRLSFSSYWAIVLVGAVLLIICGQISLPSIGQALIAKSAINPLKILILFISMTILSIFLDEMGFFRYLADRTLKHAGKSQKKLFVYLYLIVSLLTVFTSNDVIILSFTPFICYFAKRAKICAIPFLAAEFVAANTWSMALIIGNPTNIYIGTAYGINFIQYLKVMALPTVFAGLVSLLALYGMFNKQLSEEIKGETENIKIKDKLGLSIGLAHLSICTVLLAVSSYIGIEMWLISAIAVISLFSICFVVSIVRKSNLHLKECLARAPWQLIPFLLSMFVITLVLTSTGVTLEIGEFLKSCNVIFGYGLSSFMGANIINNIPMSVLFCGIIQSVEETSVSMAAFATIIGSNIGAFMTPIGALAGIMWSSILNEHGFTFGYKDFLKIGVFIAIPTLLAALLGLSICL